MYYKIPNCTMKCRMYPNAAARKCIDRIIHGAQVAYNIATYDMYTNFTNTKEVVGEDGQVYHFVDYKKVIKKDYLDWLRSQHKDICVVPSGALSGRSGLFLSDHQRAMSHRAIEYTRKDGKVVRKHDKHARTGKGGALHPYSLEVAKIDYYSKAFPRRSYTYQTTLHGHTAMSENENVFYITLVNVVDPVTQKKIPVKVRGWNQKMRFGDNQEMNFLEYVQTLDSKKLHTVTVSKDNTNQYWLCIKLADAYLPMNEKPDDVEVGLYSSELHTAVLSDGTQYDNRQFKDAKQEHVGALSAKLSRKQGWSNEQFRLNHKSDPSLKPSKGYQETLLKHAKLEQKIARKRMLHNNEVSRDIVKNATVVCLEDKDLSAEMQKKERSYELSDVATGQLLGMIKYKGTWYGRTVLGTAEDAHLRCSACGGVFESASTSSGSWVCPDCGVVLDAELNASKNILYYALHPSETGA